MNAITQILRNPRKLAIVWSRLRATPQRVLPKKGGNSQIVWAFNVAGWKREYLQNCFPELEFRYISFKDSVGRHSSKILAAEGSSFLVWGLQQPSDLEAFATLHKIKVIRMEDGFLRSVGLGANHVLPYSICVDHSGIYFDSRNPSDLEILLQGYDFAADPALMNEAAHCLKLIRSYGLTKYNEPQTQIAETVFGRKRSGAVRVLVIGQVEDDQSVIYGCERKITNNDVVRLAAAENPGAQIIYKVHPDVLAGKRAELSNPEDVAKIALIVRQRMSLIDSLTGVDRVYTISSLGGLEAMIRGVPVTTLGAPFYAGWGLTDTRQSTPQRTRKLSLEQLFAGAFLKYARYFNPQTSAPLQLREVIDLMVESGGFEAMPHQPGSDDDGGDAVGDASYPTVETGAQSDAVPVASGIHRQFLFGFPHPPELLRQVMAGEEVHVVSEPGNVSEFRRNWLPRLLDFSAEVLVWEDKLPGSIRSLLQDLPGKRTLVRQGVIHQLGIEPIAFGPFAWSFEDGTSSGPDRLIETLNSGDFVNDTVLLESVDLLRQRALDVLLGKAQGQAADRVRELLGEKTARRILILGQPEDHALVREASVRQYSNNDLVAMAHMEHPGAQIVYRPDVANVKKMRPGLSDPQAVAALCTLVPPGTPASLLIESCDHLYTISHPSGLEAILREKQVTLLGAPFYAGWGLTEDRHLPHPRARSLTIPALFAGTCVASAQYIDPVYKTISSDPVAALDRLLSMILASLAAGSSAPVVETVAAPAAAEPEAPEADATAAEDKHSLSEAQLIDRIRELSGAFLHGDAVSYARLLVEHYGEHADNLLLLARTEMDAGNNDESIAAYSRCLELSPSPKVYAERAKAKIQTGQFDETVKQDYLQAMARASGKETGIVRDYFNYCWESSPVSEGLTQQYERYLTRVRKEFPLGAKSPGGGAHPKLFSTLGSIYSEIGNVDGAISLYQEATKRNEKTSEFLGLRCLARRYGDTKAVSDDLYSLWQAMEQNQRRFRDLVIEANGEVSIVGNAPTEIGSGNGAFIDSRKLVVRFNSYDNEYPHSLDYGTKTNVWVRIPASAYVKSRGLDEGLDLIMFTGSNRLYRPFTRWGSILQYHELGIPVTVLPAKPVYELISRLNAMPSAGLTLCYMLYKIIGPLSKEHFFGFSFLEDPTREQAYHYSDQNAQVSKRHQMDRESEVFKSLLLSPGSRPSYFFGAKPAAAAMAPALVPAVAAPGAVSDAVNSRPEEEIEPEDDGDLDTLPPMDEDDGADQGPAIEAEEQDDAGDDVLTEVSSSTVDGSAFDLVMVTSKGLVDYEIFGRKPELIPRSEIALLEAGEASIGDVAALPVLSKLLNNERAVVIGFGLGPTGQLAQAVVSHSGSAIRLAEYGLISSKHLPSEKQYNFSLMFDEIGVFYDSTRPSSLEQMLNFDDTLASPEELDIARQAVRLIRNACITKYNNAPAVRLPRRRKDKRRILVIDQVAGDLSIKFGLCEQHSFQDMLHAALESDPEAEVYVKIHPEAAAGAKPPNFSAEDLAHPRVIPILKAVNIISLIKQVDEVYVMTSGVGFEALVLEKPVTCFGFPYYAGWGLTTDKVAPVRRHRQRSLLELFVCIHLRCSIYFDPDSHQASELLPVLKKLELFNRDFFRANPELAVEDIG